MWGYMAGFLAELKQLGNASPDLTLIKRHFPDPRFVWLRRQDAKAQAVSWAKATQTPWARRATCSDTSEWMANAYRSAS